MSKVSAFCVCFGLMFFNTQTVRAAETRPGSCVIAAAADLPVVDVRTRGAKGNGQDDDTAAIESALMEVEAGGTVYFPPGTYRHSGVIVVKGRNILLTGDGATLVAANPAKAAITLAGEGASISRLSVTIANPGERGSQVDESGIVVTGVGNRIIGATVTQSRSAGIFLQNAKNTEVACNLVFDTLADGIHATDGSVGGLIHRNTVRNSGDDGIAVVSYANQLRTTTQMTIQDNVVTDIRWGRGISIIGSAKATIERNRINGIAMAAGIIVAREAAFDTPGASDVVIRDNHVEDVQYNLSPRAGSKRSGHAAIELNSDSYSPRLGVSRIVVSANSILHSGFDGIRILGNVSDVAISANVIRGVKDRPILVISDNPAPVTECFGNRYANRSVACG